MRFETNCEAQLYSNFSSLDLSFEPNLFCISLKLNMSLAKWFLCKALYCLKYFLCQVLFAKCFSSKFCSNWYFPNWFLCKFLFYKVNILYKVLYEVSVSCWNWWAWQNGSCAKCFFVWSVFCVKYFLPRAFHPTNFCSN